MPERHLLTYGKEQGLYVKQARYQRAFLILSPGVDSSSAFKKKLKSPSGECGLSLLAPRSVLKHKKKENIHPARG